MTLAFLGSVAEDRIAPLTEALRAVADPIKPFRLRLETIGGFPNESRARIAWVGAHTSDRNFTSLAAAVREAVKSFAKRDDEAAVFHVTVARPRDPKPIPPISFAPCTMNVDAITLFESLPAQGTMRYEIVERFQLAGRSMPAKQK